MRNKITIPVCHLAYFFSDGRRLETHRTATEFVRSCLERFPELEIEVRGDVATVTFPDEPFPTSMIDQHKAGIATL